MVTSHVETPGEEVVNSLTHALGFTLSAMGLWIYLHQFGERPLACWSAGLFAATATLLYFCSAAYHACPRNALKVRLQRLDHAAIFLFTAGSYTPFCLLALPPQIGDITLPLVWCLSLAGALFSLSVGTRFPTLTMVLLLSLGWMAIFLLPYFWTYLSGKALAWLIGGALFYTSGTIFFATHWFRFSHAVWHAFVLFGSSCHFICIDLTAQNFPY